jgi:dTDP-4-amino-4,6-dideoxygalactose transaminase
MITTNREDYYNRLKLLRQHGMSVNDRVRHLSAKVVFEDHLELGYNYRMTDIQAAVGIKQLEKLEWIIEQRRQTAYRYHQAFKNIDFIRLPLEQEGYFSNYQSYSIFLKEDCPISRNDLMQKLLDAGIATRRGIMTTHRETAYLNYSNNVQLPVSEKASDQSIIIPLYVPMAAKDISYVIQKIKNVLTGRNDIQI